MDVGVAAAVESLPILRVQDKSKQVRYCLGSEIGGFGRWKARDSVSSRRITS